MLPLPLGDEGKGSAARAQAEAGPEPSHPDRHAHHEGPATGKAFGRFNLSVRR